MMMRPPYADRQTDGLQSPERFVLIDLNIIRDNLKNVKQYMSTQGTTPHIMAVLKANAYGHGLIAVAHALQSEVEAFAVQDASEAIRLRQSGITLPILVLSPHLPLPLAIQYHLWPTIADHKTLRQWIALSEQLHQPLEAHVAVNVSLMRYGFDLADIPLVIEQLKKTRFLKIVGLYGHLSPGWLKSEQTYWRSVLDRFLMIRDMFDAAHVDVGRAHLANSEAALSVPEMRLDMVRIGNALFGMTRSIQSVNLRPAYQIFARLVAKHHVSKGEHIGYEGRYRAKRPMTVGVVAFGTYDGFGWYRYPQALHWREWFLHIGRLLYRRLVPRPTVFFGQQSLPVIGKAGMHALFVDLTAHPTIDIGTYVRVEPPSLLLVKEDTLRLYDHEQAQLILDNKDDTWSYVNSDDSYTLTATF